MEDHMQKTQAYRDAQKRYDAKSTVFIGLKLNKKTDADIIAAIEKQDSKQGYIKDCIRRCL